MSKKGLFESMLNSFQLWAAVHDSKDEHGKPNADKAFGIAHLMNSNLGSSDLEELAGYLDDAEAFYTPAENPAPHNAPKRRSSYLNGLHPSMDWHSLSQEEKNRRIRKAIDTKELYRDWKNRWRIEEHYSHLQPL